MLHTAAMSHPELSLDLPITTVAANINGTLSVLEAVRFAKVARVVNFSSECAYGDQHDGPVREDARVRPSTPYGVTKVTTEMLAEVYARRYERRRRLTPNHRGLRAGKPNAVNPARDASRRDSGNAVSPGQWRGPPVPVRACRRRGACSVRRSDRHGTDATRVQHQWWPADHRARNRGHHQRISFRKRSCSSAPGTSTRWINRRRGTSAQPPPTSAIAPSGRSRTGSAPMRTG